MRPLPITVTLALFAATSSHASAQVDSTAAQPPVVTHTVKRGDTLWDLAQFYLKDPFLWPQIFHVNTGVVKNPHWIYPGQLLSIPRSAVRDNVAANVDKNGRVVSRIRTRPADQATVFLAPTPTALPGAGMSIEKPRAYTIREGEYEAAPFMVDEKHPPSAGKIVSAVDRTALDLRSDASFKINDRLYVTAPTGHSLQKGDLMLLARRADVILDVGRVVEPTGVLRVDSVQGDGPVLAEIVKQFGPIMLDQITLSYERTFHPTVVRPVSGEYQGKSTVLWIKGNPPLPSLQTYVIIETPVAVEVHPGDEFTLYDQDKAHATTIPPVATAKVQVVRVTPFGVTGLIIGQSQPKVGEGMVASLTAKMP